MSKIIGIDLGTTNSVVAIIEGGDPIVIPTSEGHRILPSVVAFNKNGERLTGFTAKRQSVVNSENTVYSIKRFMGRHFDEVTDERKMVSYEVIKGSSGDARVKIPQTGKTYTPQEISAMILGKLKQEAEAYLGETVTQAVITVPAYFNDAQRQATKDAGRIAGLEVLRIINEPTAAALAYGLDKQKNETILVFDLGGGTFDVSVLEVGEGVVEVKSTNGDTHLGGDDWDQKIVDWAADEFKTQAGVELRKDRQALQRLREAAEKAKIELSSVLETELNLPFITADATGPKHLTLKLSRAKFEQITHDLLERCRRPFEQALKDAGFTAAQLNNVVLVGGSSRMPMAQELARKLTNGKEAHKGVNPDEVVALGAAIQAGVLAGDVKDVLLLDVTPLTLSIETMGGVATPLIERNTTIPVKKSQIFSTADDNQTAVDVHILQGERPMAADNMTLGKFRLDGIVAAPRGVPQIEVTYDIDANGILNVSAKDQATGKEQKITITASTNLNKADVERMVKEAKSHAGEDRQRKEVIEARNTGDSLVYQAERALRDLGDKVPGNDKQKIESQVVELREALKGEDLGRIKSLSEQLQQAVYALSQQLYASGQSGGSTGPQAERRDEGDVVEGEFTEA